MRKRVAFVLMVLVAVAAFPRHVSASPEKSAAKLEVTYYYLPG